MTCPCIYTFTSIHPSIRPTVPPPLFSLNKSHQTHYKWPLGSIYTHLSAGPSQWGGPTAVWGETGTAVWVSWRPRSHCLSNPSTGRTWGRAGPVGMMSSARRRGPTGLDETYLHDLQHLWRDWNTEREREGKTELLAACKQLLFVGGSILTHGLPVAFMYLHIKPVKSHNLFKRYVMMIMR